MPDEKPMHIDGAWVPASGNRTYEVVSPVDGSVLAAVAKATRDDAANAVAAAERAFRDPAWRRMDPSERGRLLQRAALIARERADEIARLESTNQGKPLREAKADVLFAIATLEYYAGLADKIEGGVIPVSGPRFAYTLREPLGPTVHIIPWNYPFQLGVRSVAPALAAGNTVVAKPASQTPLTFLVLAEIFEKAGFPKGVFNVVTGSGSEAGAALAADGRVRGVVLTGSVETGQKLLAETARNLVPTTLELGGKSPNIVFPDADLDKAVKGAAFGIFLNAGQMCWAGSRLLLHESIHDAFVEKLAAFAKTWKLGNPLEKDTRMGPLVSKEHRERVESYVAVAEKEGAKLVLGGKRPEDPALAAGAFYGPTIFTDVAPASTLAREEVFGPVLAVMKFKDETDALRLANGVDFGLYAGVWTKDLARAHRVAADLESGQVAVNEYPVTFPQVPFGGLKRSGLGSEQGLSALEFYTRRKSVMMNLG
ncbi:MAG TPA: aldehyde dehydrogenase family protein [Candidatus Thermoplasmatota archaeon]|nr:aldehyde dehydrogenase family protein [Candidatus Thermoplasmatota archaeon]